MVRLVAVGEGGCRRVEEGEAVCAELTVPLGARLNCEARERRLDARL